MTDDRDDPADSRRPRLRLVYSSSRKRPAVLTEDEVGLCADCQLEMPDRPERARPAAKKAADVDDEIPF